MILIFLLEWVSFWVDVICGHIGGQFARGKVSARKGASICALALLVYGIALDLIDSHQEKKLFTLSGIGLSAGVAVGMWFVFYGLLRFMGWLDQRCPGSQRTDRCSPSEVGKKSDGSMNGREYGETQR
ncbi:hypothetical protein [Paludibacterium sp. B53371]|uniref:hypothetical protein n=1 Tax=Paludibacterium sp. B53371 TaxID=2806263 RepID=UPI001C04FE87|nr:hypothetical protein [Paludibacterium sp. B53371]